MQRSFGRLLQFVGLTIPPLSILLQLEQAVGPGTMLQMLLASVCVFVIGYYVAAYAA